MSSEPRYQHSAEELRHVADILDVLNAGDKCQTCAASGGSIDIYWCDSFMGKIVQYLEPDSWAYFPVARTHPRAKETP